MSLSENSLLLALRAGETRLGCGFGYLNSIEAMRALAAAGFAWAFVDLEHGFLDFGPLQELCRASQAVGFAPLVRVADLQYSLVARVLDCGAPGVVFPRVEDPAKLREAISWTKFPPVGIRGYGLTPPHLGYRSVPLATALAHHNQHTMVVLQIETVTAVARREELIGTAGVDAVMVGPADLSISLGVPGEFQHPKMVEAMEQIRDTCLRHGVTPGCQTRSVELAKFWQARGMKLLGCSNEAAMLFDAASSIVQSLR
jgi:2-keto-3-deoxy-L-rhamnonate aldolase RhmA